MDLKPREEIEKMSLGYNKVLPMNLLNQIKKYNKWVRKRQRQFTTWRPKPYRTAVKKPFKFSNVFYAKSDHDIDSNPEIKKMMEDDDLEPDEE